MEIQSRTEGNATVVTVKGRMDVLTTPAYEKKLNDLIANGTTSLVMDFDGLEYISSAGLRGILSTDKALKAKGGQVCFVNVKGAIREVLDMSGFGTIFQIYDSVDSALSGIG